VDADEVAVGDILASKCHDGRQASTIVHKLELCALIVRKFEDTDKIGRIVERAHFDPNTGTFWQLHNNA
jgi:hypothetical protein